MNIERQLKDCKANTSFELYMFITLEKFVQAISLFPNLNILMNN